MVLSLEWCLTCITEVSAGGPGMLESEWDSSSAPAELSEAEVDVFPEFSCFFYDPTDVGNLISGSSDFSKSSL